MVSERVTVEEAAKILGLAPQGVREHMKRNLFDPPIGQVTQLSPKRREYLIYRDKLNRYIGKVEGA